LDVSWEESLPPVLADPDHITQVLSNLIVNAGHAIAGKGKSGRVRVRGYRDVRNDQVVIDIQDNGTGIPHDIRHRIFEPFFTTKDVNDGTGFGLAFCHQVVTAHGGTLTLHTPDAGGALFRMRLSVTHRTRQPAAPKTVRRRNASALSVMVLDDEEIVANLLCDLLTAEGWKVDVQTSARAALRRCEDQLFDVVISDLRMPDMDGQSFFRALEKLRPAQIESLMFLTGDTMNSDVTDFVAKCGRPCLEKPITPSELLRTVTEIAARETT
jgi:CheY-like chemotaxis protein